MAVIYASARARVLQMATLGLDSSRRSECPLQNSRTQNVYAFPSRARRSSSDLVSVDARPHAQCTRASAAHENLHTRPMKEWSRPGGVVVVVVTECPKNSDVCLLYTSAAAVCLEILTAKRTRYMITFRAREKNRETAADTYVPGRRK